MAEKSSADAGAPDASGRRYFGKKAKCQELKAEQQENYMKLSGVIDRMPWKRIPAFV